VDVGAQDDASNPAGGVSAAAAGDGAVRPLRDAREADRGALQRALPIAELETPVSTQLAERRVIAFEVLGEPAPKGSARAFVNKKTGRAFVAPGGRGTTEVKIANWNSAVREAAARTIGAVEAPPFVETALAVTVVFHMKRPKGHWGTGKRAGTILASAPARPMGKPDIDKLARTTLDAMTGCIFDDDSRIASLTLDKRWAAPGREGATITIAEAT
jgi:Holliday junction resolvase RusA-like endonuclease